MDCLIDSGLFTEFLLPAVWHAVLAFRATQNAHAAVYMQDIHSLGIGQALQLVHLLGKGCSVQMMMVTSLRSH